MSAVFADTFYFLGLVSRKDRAHRMCLEFSESSDRPVVTTIWVLMEVGDALCRGRDRGVLLHLLETLQQEEDVFVLPADQEQFDRGLALFKSRPDKSWSLTDCTSFAVMQELGLTDALTSDHHFQQAGYNALLTS